MPRARGVNAALAAVFESTYGTPPGTGFRRMPFASVNIGEEQGLIASELLGFGREPLAPVYDVITNTGDLVVPVDTRNIGVWLRGLMGAPTTIAANAATGTITLTANLLVNDTVKPWSPAHVRGARNGAGDLTISWVRRTRYGGWWRDLTDVPLNEETERYEVDVMNGSTVLRTLAVSAPAAIYTAAQQVADFGSAQASVTVRVVQLSTAIGRGTPALATL